jgi:multidrug efflux pump subunit AcrA (membrane-fusion protein)
MASARAAAASEAALERQQGEAETQRAAAARSQLEADEAQQKAAEAAAVGFGGCPDCAAARAHASHLEVKNDNWSGYLMHVDVCTASVHNQHLVICMDHATAGSIGTCVHGEVLQAGSSMPQQLVLTQLN